MTTNDIDLKLIQWIDDNEALERYTKQLFRVLGYRLQRAINKPYKFWFISHDGYFVLKTIESINLDTDTALADVPELERTQRREIIVTNAYIYSEVIEKARSHGVLIIDLNTLSSKPLEHIQDLVHQFIAE